jgi:hypothetical protein
MGARGKRRGFRPEAAARYSGYICVWEIILEYSIHFFFPVFFSVLQKKWTGRLGRKNTPIF